MKVAFFNRSMSKGGAEKMLSFVINSVSTIAESIVIVQYSNENSGYGFPNNVIHEKLKIDDGSHRNKLKKIFDLFVRIKQLRKILIKYEIDTLCTFGYYFTMMGVIATVGTSIKIIASERRSPQDNKWPWTILSRVIYANCDRVIFQLQQARSYYNNISNDKVAVIHNPYIPNEIKSAYEYSCTREEIVMAASRLEYVKGFDVGIRSMAEVIRKYPNYKLVIYGAGNFSSQYDKLICELGLVNHVIYKGHSQNILEEIISSRIFLFPSRVEGIPNMLLEAMGVGMPCVAADCTPGGARLLIGENNEYGQLVPVDDVNSTANAIIRYIEDPDYLIKMSESAKSVKSRFCIDDISNKWIENFRILE